LRGGERADEELPLNIGLENKRSFPEESFWDAFYLNNFKILPFFKGKMHLPGYLEKKLFLETPPRGSVSLITHFTLLSLGATS
jgi:hypothetical protein